MQNNFDFQIKELNLVVNWDLDTQSKTCDLCRKLLLAPSVLELKNGIDGVVQVGMCDHAFHKTCIDNFLKENSCTICPTDKIQWKVKHSLNTGVIYK